MKWLAYLGFWVPILLIGCGGGSNMPPVPPVPLTISGNFGMTAASTGPDTFQIGGPIQSSPNGMVTGTVRVDSSTSTCFDFFTPLTVSGTLSSQGSLSMTTSAYQLQTISLTGMVSSDGKTISGGTFSVT